MGVLGFSSCQGLGIFLFTTVFRLALGREADHSPPSSTEVKNAWNCISVPPIRLHSMVLGQLYLYMK